MPKVTLWKEWNSDITGVEYLKLNRVNVLEPLLICYIAFFENIQVALEISEKGAAILGLRETAVAVTIKYWFIYISNLIP